MQYHFSFTFNILNNIPCYFSKELLPDTEAVFLLQKSFDHFHLQLSRVDHPSPESGKQQLPSLC